MFQLRVGARCFKSPAHSLDKGVEMGAGASVVILSVKDALPLEVLGQSCPRPGSRYCRFLRSLWTLKGKQGPEGMAVTIPRVSLRRPGLPFLS